jgi:hypothetical protein
MQKKEVAAGNNHWYVRNRHVPGKNPSFFHLSQMRKRRGSQMITKVLEGD